MTTKPNGPRDPRATLKAISAIPAEDEFDEIVAMSDEELDREITKHGGDPQALRQGGATLAAELFRRREALVWQDEMGTKLKQVRDAAERTRVQSAANGLPRAELLRRLDLARTSPRFSEPIAILFQKKSLSASTDEELAALLEQVELLTKLEE